MLDSILTPEVSESVAYPGSPSMTYYPFADCVNRVVSKLIESGAVSGQYAAKQGYPVAPLPPYKPKAARG